MAKHPVAETDIALRDGRTLHVYDTHPDDIDGRLVVFWHHGTPNIGIAAGPPLRRVGSARHPLGVVRPAGVRRLGAHAGTGYRLGGDLRQRCC